MEKKTKYPMAASSSMEVARSMEEEASAAVVHGTVLDHFAESEELMSLVTALPLVSEELRSREKSEERFTGNS